jgi:hypothetical protein
VAAASCPDGSPRDRPGTDTSVVDEDVDPTKPGAGGSGNFIGGDVGGQIGLQREEVVRLSLLTGARRECRQRLTLPIDAGDPDACRQKTPHHRPADAAGGTGHDRRSVDFGHAALPSSRVVSIYSSLE